VTCQIGGRLQTLAIRDFGSAGSVRTFALHFEASSGASTIFIFHLS
jgi:hypothetical protein